MKFILAQPAIQRFKWELDVCLWNLKSLGVTDIVLLFSKYDDSIPKYFEEKYGARCYVYPDKRIDKTYIPSIKPYLWWQFLKHNPEMEKETYFYMDADVIFRELPNFNKLSYSSKLWVGSNTDGYLSPSYIDSKGEDLLSRMANIIQVDEEKVRNLQNRSAGAQWVLTQPGAQYWYKVYQDSVKLYSFFNRVESEYVNKNKGTNYTPIQKWTAEMWSQLWNMILFDIDVKIEKELDFCWATDDIKKWDTVKIYHNAGVTSDMHDLFFKGIFVKISPLTFGSNFEYVNKNKCSWKYVQALLKCKNREE